MPTWLIITIVIAALWIVLEIVDRSRKKDMEHAAAEKLANTVNHEDDLFIR